MVCSEKARVIEAPELREMLEEEYTNPTVERLMFIETKTKEGVGGKIFPCFIEGVLEEKDAKVKMNPELLFRMCITQSMEGMFSMVRVNVSSAELGINKRIWDKPPTKGLRDETPWVEKGAQ